MAIGADYVAPYLGRMDDAGMDVRTPLLWVQRITFQWSGCLPASKVDGASLPAETVARLRGCQPVTCDTHCA
jgi:transaldolase